MANNRADSVHEEHKIATDALKGREPPSHITLREMDLPFWNAIIGARAVWTDIDLAHAANLARCQADIEENQKLLDSEGNVLKNARGTPVMNPRFTILEQLSRRSVALSAKLQVHAAATVGESKQSRGKNNKKREILEAFDTPEEDDLLAKPQFN